MKRKLLIGATIYGDHYWDLFYKYCLPSLMSPGNFPALLQEMECGIIIHTDKAGENRFKGSGFNVIPDVMEGDKYEQIGRQEHQDLKLAKELGADYHLLLPDYVYSDNCFRNVLELAKTHKAISRLVVSTVEEDIGPWLTQPLSAIHLATLSLQHIHPGVRHWLASKEGFPNNHVIVWPAKHTLRMCSPHQTPVYIANEAIKLDDSSLPLDCILDRVIDGPIYCTQAEDDICIIELSSRNSRQPNDKRIDLNEFVRIMKADTNDSVEQQQLFMQETIDRINRLAIGGAYWNEVEISAQKDIVMKALRE